MVNICMVSDEFTHDFQGDDFRIAQTWGKAKGAGWMSLYRALQALFDAKVDRNDRLFNIKHSLTELVLLRRIKNAKLKIKNAYCV